VIRLSGFADEISPHLDEQIATLERERIHYVDLRGVSGTNVLDLTDEQIARIKRTLDDHGIGVATIASPIGKVPIDSSFDEHLQRFERAIALAQIFRTPYIRIFSFYPPAATANGDGDAPAPSNYRDEVLRRLREMTARARAPPTSSCCMRMRRRSTATPSLGAVTSTKTVPMSICERPSILPISSSAPRCPIQMPTMRSIRG